MLDRRGSEKEEEENKFTSELRNAVQEKYVNSVITFIIICATLYLSFLAVFERNIAHPLTPSANATSISDGGHTVFSLLVLLLCSLALGWILSIIKLPPLLGALLTGIAFRNIPLLSDNFSVDSNWEYCIRTLALCCIIIRWGIGLDAKAIKKRPFLLILLGIGSPVAEVATITLAAHFIFSFSLPLAILCGFILAAVSPAVTVPVALEVQKEGRGIKNAVCSLILAASSIDNLFCISAFTSAVSLIFSTQAPTITVLWTLLQIFTGLVSGCIIGCLLWYFPLSTSPYVHVLRGILMATTTISAVLGGNAVGWNCAGIISSILFCFIGATRWKIDNDEGVKGKESAFAVLWNFCFMPLLFSLIGLKFDFDQLNSSTILCSLCLIGLGAIARFVCALLLSTLSLDIKESIFSGLAFLPKATVQAALSPSLIVYTVSHPHLSTQLQTIMTASIVTILVTAPIGQLVLQLSSHFLLKKDGAEKKFSPSYVYTNPVGSTSLHSNSKTDVTEDEENGSPTLRM